MSDTAQVANDFVRRRWYHRRDLRFLAICGAILAMFYSYGYVNGPARISDQLDQAMNDDAQTVNIVVTAKFPAEEFHLGIYQEIGQVRGSDDTNTTLFQVKPKDIRALARNYWIVRIDLAPPEKK